MNQGTHQDARDMLELKEFPPREEREETKGEKGLYPLRLRSGIDDFNDWVYDKVESGVYKTGFVAA